MIGIYFSGTGNTKYAVTRFIEKCGDKDTYSIENIDAVNSIKENDDIVFGYPIYYSNLPKIVKDFINNNADIWKGKKVFIIATMGLFSGDGTGCAARLLSKHGAEIIGGMHLKMPDCIGDVKLLKKSLEDNKRLLRNTEDKIDRVVSGLKRGKKNKEGLGIISQIAGLLGQRLWFYNKTAEYSNKLKIDESKCIVCGKCVKLCPMNNIEIRDRRVLADSRCTMCYRCISNCPEMAITLLGDKVLEQSVIEKYI